MAGQNVFSENCLYFKVSNNCAANLINFWKKSNLHALIPSYIFIYFWKKFLPAQLFHPTQFLGSMILREDDHFVFLSLNTQFKFDLGKNIGSLFS